MVARSGLFVAPVAGSPPVGMAPTDARIAFSALIGTTPQCASGGAITQSASTMAITIASGTWQLPDVSNSAGTSTFLSAIDQTVVNPTAGPATGSRIDLIVGKQNNIENSDADSRANLFLMVGTPGAPGVAPGIPSGAYIYATVTVPAGASNAAAATVVIARPITFGPLPLKAATLALLNTVSGSLGQVATVMGDASTVNGIYNWSGAQWVKALKMTAGIVSAGVTDGVGNYAVTHNLGFIPVSVQVTGAVGPTIPERLTYNAYSFTATTFIIKVYRQDTGAIFASNAISANWLAVG